MKSLCLLFVLTGSAFSAITIPLPGDTKTSTWNGLKIGNTTPVGGAHVANGTTLQLSSGGPLYTSSGSGIYSGFAGPATFSITDSGFTDINTLVFEVRLDAAPTLVELYVNGTLTALTPDYSTSAGTGGTSSMGGAILDRAWQFDLTSQVDPVTSYELKFTLAAHTVIYASAPVQVIAGDQFALAVPEPSSALLALSATGLLFNRRRRA